MRTIRKILVAIRDPGAKVLPAVDKAAQLALVWNAEVELFHAIDMPRYVGFDDLSAQYLPQIEHIEHVRCISRMEAIAATLRERGITTATHAGWDFPAGEAIVRRANRIHADLIVAECHAGEHRGAWLLRLTDWDLLRYSPLPVLLVKNKRPYHRPQLLAAVDPTHAFSKPARLDEEILRTADFFRKGLRGKLHVAHAYVPMPSDAKPDELLDPAATKILRMRARQHAQARLQPLLKKLEIARTSRHLLDEHPIDGIPRLARNLGCDIVVMGAISRSGLKRIFIGNTAERMLDLLDCDVLVVKPPGVRLKAVTYAERSSRTPGRRQKPSRRRETLTAR